MKKIKIKKVKMDKGKTEGTNNEEEKTKRIKDYSKKPTRMCHTFIYSTL